MPWSNWPNAIERVDKVPAEDVDDSDGEVDALVAVKSRDLSSPYHYLTIAEIYQKADQADLALNGPNADSRRSRNDQTIDL
jgi:hypothetical protein